MYGPDTALEHDLVSIPLGTLITPRPVAANVKSYFSFNSPRYADNSSISSISNPVSSFQFPRCLITNHGPACESLCRFQFS